jgi:hypothetical protein
VWGLNFLPGYWLACLGGGGGVFLFFCKFLLVFSGLFSPRVNSGFFWILYRFVTRPSITGHFVDFIYCQLCEISLRDIWCTRYVLAIGKQTRSSFRLNLFIPPPPNGHASETRLYSVFSFFFQFLCSQLSLTLFQNGRRSQLICYRVEEDWGSDCILFFYPFSRTSKISFLFFISFVFILC